MSRLIVKNLPKLITEEKLKNLFGEYGIVTDIQLKYKDGKFRQFAFIGYKNEDEAQKAIQSLDKTFISTSRITVEPCALLGDSQKPKSWSKYASDSNAYKKTHKHEEKPKQQLEDNKEEVEENETVELIAKYKSDPLFEDFLQVHKKEALTVEKLLSKTIKDNVENQECDEENKGEDSGNNEEDDEKLANKSISDLDYMKQLKKSAKSNEKKIKEKVDFFTIKLKGLPYNCKKKDIKAFLKPLSAQSIRVPRKIHGIAFVGFKDEKKFKKALLKNKSFLSGHQIFITKYEVESKEADEKDSGESKHSKWVSQEESLKNEEEIAESGRIFIRNLAYTTTEDDLRPLFEKYGPITELNLPIDPTSRQIKGFGTITYLMPEHAVRAYSELDGSICQGRMLHLLPAKAKDSVENNNIEESSNYKQKKAALQKAKAGHSYNWNALFLGHDAVAEVISDTFGTQKEDIVGPDGKGSVAVRLALGETKIVSETKKYLEAEGVNLDAFKMMNCKRSNRIILVKNLPSQTRFLEIKELFEKFGVISRIILPPSGITAVVEFDEAAEARKAFKRLAYSKFKNVPLYLEWAPEDSLKEKNSNIQDKKDDMEVKNNENEPEKNEVSEDDEEPEPDTTLFVKNLNFKTTDEDLKKFFENCGKIHYATVARKKDTKNPGATLSMGYGFVRFKTKAATDKALKTMQQSVLDGKSLELKRSERILQTDVEVQQRKAPKNVKQNGTKLLVRNVPFQANKKEIQELFSVFGEIKALRLPKKLSGESHRGFAFVDYVTNSDAKKAFEALSQSTHLYGRRLVLEWAELEGDEATGKRSAENFQKDEGDSNKKFRKSVFNME
ncbi:probable RNA-binding protein 19 [Coccinella septempunctata]|uniref:probable RNA-binding protein 19 n=1 Tax=Coccinella septempunctata TaxID=41139 RepID=UPI001D0949E8|nr:probable RNA-binding protein 19 [Coccinella septempunctata]